VTDGEPPATDPGDWLPLLRVGLAAAACWHLLGNAGLADGLPPLLVGAGAAAVALAPHRRLPFVVLTVAVWLSIWQEAPFLGNHWLLTGLLCAAVSLAGLDRDPGRPVAAAQAVLLVFYSFAAFAKLNADFFDPSTSCATFYSAESAASLGWDVGRPHGAAGMALVLLVATTELLVPVLLVLRRTRVAGVAMAVAFHAVLALDHRHQFYDFTMLLTVVFVTFLPADAAARVRAATGGRERRAVLQGAAAVLALTAGVVAGGDAGPDAGLELGYAAWAVATAALLPAVLVWCRRHRAAATERAASPGSRWAVPIVALVVLNGLSPYLELKTGTAWNMYGNLRTVDGDSNHFLVRATLPLGDAQADLVEVVEADGLLAAYVGADALLPRRQLRWFLQHHREESATLLVGGQEVELTPGTIPPELGPPVPEVVGKLAVLRAVAPEGAPVPCQDFFRPAG
jgi:hypothetical protein